MISAKRLPSQDYLKSLLNYDSETGAFTWKVSRSNRIKVGQDAGRSKSRRYKVINIDGSLYAVHRLAWQFAHGTCPPELDHINGKSDDNRLCNLRPCSHSDNLRNKKRQTTNRAGLKGVSRIGGGDKWAARIFLSGRLTHIGTFHTAEDAHSAYVREAEKHFGEFARVA